jgi:hypothetical protein
MSIREATVGLLSGGGPSGSVVVVVGVVFGCTSTYFLLVSKKASGLSVGGIGGAYARREGGGGWSELSFGWCESSESRFFHGNRTFWDN